MTPRFDRSVAGFAFAPDGRTLYLTAEDSGFVKLFSVPARGGDTLPVLESRGVYSGDPGARGRASALHRREVGIRGEPGGDRPHRSR